MLYFFPKSGFSRQYYVSAPVFRFYFVRYFMFSNKNESAKWKIESKVTKQT